MSLLRSCGDKSVTNLVGTFMLPLYLIIFAYLLIIRRTKQIMKPEKIDPALLAALDDFDNDGKAALTTHSNMLGLNAAVGSQQPAFGLVCCPKVGGFQL
jgi:hypothetical protein